MCTHGGCCACVTLRAVGDLSSSCRFQSQFKTDTRGTGVLNRVFDHYGAFQDILDKSRKGALISNGPGKTTSYALSALEPRGKLFVGAGVDVYEGMLVGEHSRANDLEVNPVKGKKLTNMRASGAMAGGSCSVAWR